MNHRPVQAATFFISLLFIFMSSSVAAQVRCGDYIFSDLRLDSDLICTGSGFALNPVGSNIMINLNGHTIEGPSSMRGISMRGADRVSIIGPGVIRGFWAGIDASESDDLVVSDIVFFEVGSGVLLQQTSRAQISNNQFIYTRGEAVNIRGLDTWKHSSKENSIAKNEFYKSRVGVRICGNNAFANTIESNLIWRSEDWGIHLDNTKNNRVENNEIIETEYSAVRIENGSGNRIAGNNLENGQAGLSILTSDASSCGVPEMISENNTVQYNYIVDFYRGLYLSGGSGPIRENLIGNNKIYDNNIGIFFDLNALNNNAARNGYQDTVTKIIDLGSGNEY